MSLRMSTNQRDQSPEDRDSQIAPLLSRREMLSRCGGGLGLVGLAATLAQDGRLAQAADSAHPLAVKPPHFAPRVKYVIQYMANGGPAQMDTFDPKPILSEYHGRRLPLHLLTERPTGSAFGSPFKFAQYGQSGLWASELF